MKVLVHKGRRGGVMSRRNRAEAGHAGAQLTNDVRRIHSVGRRRQEFTGNAEWFTVNQFRDGRL
jgi:hypothetical protein